MKPFWISLLDLFSPRICAGCGNRLSVGEHALCNHCLQHLPFTFHSLQPYDNQLARLFWGLFPIERAAAWFFYEPNTEMARMMHEMKYRGRSDVAEDLGQQMAAALHADGFFDSIDAIVPVPLTRRRRWHRGYNQSECIACGISRVTALPILNKVVERTSFQSSQTHLHLSERRANVEHAFRLRRASGLEGKHLLLVDDVVTTGSTLTACALQLSRIPDVRISVLTLGQAKS
jgi:ComF family protein